MRDAVPAATQHSALGSHLQAWKMSSAQTIAALLPACLSHLVPLRGRTSHTSGLSKEFLELWEGPKGDCGGQALDSWFISVLRSQFPTSLEISSRSPSGAWSPWRDLHVAAGVREEWDLALHGSKLILGVKLEQILGHSQGCWDFSAWGIPEQLHTGFRAERWQQVQAGAYLPRGGS